MRLRIPPILRRSRPCRSYSTDATPYHRKVHALPFALDFETAESAVRAAGVFSTVSLSSIFRMLFGMGSNNLVLERFSPVYLPMWFLDAEVEFKCTKDGRAVEPTFYVAGAQMPGHSHPQLATLFARSRLGEEHPPIPFEPSFLRTNWSQDVIALPYTASPLSLPALARSISPQDCELDEMTKLDASSIRFGMLSATPVLYPIYLAEFTHKGGGPNGQDKAITVAVTAANGEGDSENQPQVFLRSTGHPSGWACLNDPEYKANVGGTACLVYDPAIDMSIETKLNANDTVLDQGLRDLVTPWLYKGDWGALGAEKDWEDTRIAPWEPVGEEKRKQYMEYGQNILVLKRALALVQALCKLGTFTGEEAHDTLEAMLNGGFNYLFNKSLQGADEAAERPLSAPPKQFEERIATFQKERDQIREELKLGGEQAWGAKVAKAAAKR